MEGINIETQYFQHQQVTINSSLLVYDALNSIRGRLDRSPNRTHKTTQLRLEHMTMRKLAL